MFGKVTQDRKARVQWERGMGEQYLQQRVRDQFKISPATGTIFNKILSLIDGFKLKKPYENDEKLAKFCCKNILFFYYALLFFVFFQRYFNYLECFVVHLCFVINNWFKFYCKYYTMFWFLVCGLCDKGIACTI